jgi:MFS transporter, putative metabolite:H+ symporter
MATYLSHRGASLGLFYANCLALGFAIGYWAVFVTIASEQFGTNIRSTVTTTVPNFIRGSVLPLTFAFQQLKTPLGILGGAAAVGAGTLLIAYFAVERLEETHGKNLDYVE